MNDNTYIGANGVLPFKLGARFAWMKFDIVGGPFDAYRVMKNATFGVCVRAERVPEVGVNVHLPIEDFGVPTDKTAVEEALIATIKAAIRGDVVYVGCMGGWGRTGLFMALIAKALGIPGPISYVRDNYTSKAVETVSQVRYVNGFDVRRVQKVVRRAAWIERIRRVFRFK